MAFLNRISGVLKQTASKHMNMELSASNTSLYQAIRSMSSSKLFVGGLSYSTDEMSLREAFAAHGEVVDAKIIMDRENGRSRGFGFVTYTSSEEANAAITGLDGKEFHGRQIRVNYANDRPPRTGGFYSGGGRGAYGGNTYGGGPGYGNASNYGTGGGYPSSFNEGAGYGTGNYNSGSGYPSSFSEGAGYGTGNYNSGSGYPSSFSEGAGYGTGNYNSGSGSNYAAGEATNPGGFYNSSAPTNDGGYATSGYDQGEVHGKQTDTVGLDEGFGSDTVEESNRDDDDAPNNYANTRS